MSQYATAHAHALLPPDVITVGVSYRAMKNFNYLIVDPESGQAVIVDPAWEMVKIGRALYEAQASLCGILITHSHADHTHLAGALAERFDCPIWMSHEEIAASRFSAKRLVGIDETPIEVGEMYIEPILTPGHTPGSMCYLIGDNLFTGDVLFAEGCGMCPDTQAAHAMFDSLQQLRKRTTPHTLVYPAHSYGHPPGRTMAQLCQENKYLQFQDRESFAAFRLRSGQGKAVMV